MTPYRGQNISIPLNWIKGITVLWRAKISRQRSCLGMLTPSCFARVSAESRSRVVSSTNFFVKYGRNCLLLCICEYPLLTWVIRAKTIEYGPNTRHHIGDYSCSRSSFQLQIDYFPWYWCHLFAKARNITYRAERIVQIISLFSFYFLCFS